MAALLCTLLALGISSVLSVPPPSCDAVYRNVAGILASYEQQNTVAASREWWEERKASLRHMLHVDIDDEAQLKRLTCAVMGVESVDELLDLFPAPQPVKEMLRNTYHELVAEIPREPAFKEMERLMYDVMERFMDVTGFPNFPLGVTAEEAMLALRALGPATEKIFPFMQPGYTREYAGALASAGDVEMFADMTSTRFFVDEYKTIVERTKYARDMSEYSWKLMEQMESMGLLDLPDHRQRA